MRSIWCGTDSCSIDVAVTIRLSAHTWTHDHYPAVRTSRHSLECCMEDAWYSPRARNKALQTRAVSALNVECQGYREACIRAHSLGCSWVLKTVMEAQKAAAAALQAHFQDIESPARRSCQYKDMAHTSVRFRTSVRKQHTKHAQSSQHRKASQRVKTCKSEREKKMHIDDE